jgi:hypothetical protein
MNSKKDASQLTTFVQAVLISTDFLACHTVDARTVKSGATHWYNASAQKIPSGTVPVVSLVLVVCFTVTLDVIVLWEPSSMEPLVVKFHPQVVQPFPTVF